MKKKITNKKITASITLDKKILKVVDDNFSNRSKFIENVIIEELCKSDELKEELKKINIIL
jgi:metal-responsive CopG/Arc/MetJ family transcriptional regulator